MSGLSTYDRQILAEADALIHDRFNPSKDLAVLSIEWQTYLAVCSHVELIKSGGLPFFFDGNFPGNPDYSIFSEAYRRIGCEDMALWLEEAVALFPFNAPHQNREKRQAYMKEHCSKGTGELCELGYRMMDSAEVAYRHLAEYVRMNRVTFQAGSGGAATR